MVGQGRRGHEVETVAPAISQANLAGTPANESA